MDDGVLQWDGKVRFVSNFLGFYASIDMQR